MLIESVRWHDGWGTVSTVFHYILVEIPFALQRLLVSMIVLIINMLDFSGLFASHRRIAFEHSRQIWLNFIGHENGNISNGSVAFFFILIATLYLAWQFFLSRKGDFGKKALHMALVVTLGFAYFGSWTINGVSTLGGIVMLDTLDNVSRDIRATMLIDFVPVGTQQIGSITGEGDFARFYEAHVIGTTFNFINSGSMSGEYASGQFLDMELLIPPEEWETGHLFEIGHWVRERDNYIDNLAERNPWVRANMALLVPRGMMVLLGFVNAIILAVPIIYVNLTITAFEVINWILILFFPFALIISFIPFLRGVAFKVLKTMVIISFLPVLLGFLLLIFFYLNQVIDSIILEVVGQVLGGGGMTMNSVPNGIAGLSVFAVMIIVKIFLFLGAWKNKAALLSFISGGAISPQIMANVDAPTEAMKEYTEKPMNYLEEKYETATTAILGSQTGDVESVKEEVNAVLDQDSDEDVEVEKTPLSDMTEMFDDELEQTPLIDVESEELEDEAMYPELMRHDVDLSEDDVADVKVLNHGDMSTDIDIQVGEDSIEPILSTNVDTTMMVNKDQVFHDFMKGQTRLNGETVSNESDLIRDDLLLTHEFKQRISDEPVGMPEMTIHDYLKKRDQLYSQTIEPPVKYSHYEKTEMDLFMEKMEKMRNEH